MENRLAPSKHNSRQSLMLLAENVRQGRPVIGDYCNPFPLGMHFIEGANLVVHGEIEVCGDNLRVFIYEGDYLRYTTRLTQVGQMWYVADPNAQVEVRKGQGLITYEYLYEKRRATPEAWVTYLYTCVYNPSNARRSTYAHGRIPSFIAEDER